MTAPATLAVEDLALSADDLLDAASGDPEDSGIDAPPPPAKAPPRKRSNSSRKRSSSAGRKRPSSTSRPAASAASSTSSGPSARDQLAAMHETIAMSVIFLSMSLPAEKRPTDAEIDAIFQPLEQIYVRHAAAWTPNPDIPLAIAATMGVVGYLQRIGAFRSLAPGVPRRPTPQAAPTPFRPRAPQPAQPQAQAAPTAPTPPPTGAPATTENVLATFHADNFGAIEDA